MTALGVFSHALDSKTKRKEEMVSDDEMRPTRCSHVMMTDDKNRVRVRHHSSHAIPIECPCMP